MSVVRAGPLKKEAALFWRKKNCILTSKNEFQVDKDVLVLDPDNKAHKAFPNEVKGKEFTFMVVGALKGKGNLTSYTLQADTQGDMEGWLFELDKALGKESQYTPKEQLGVKTLTPSTASSKTDTSPSSTTPKRPNEERGIDLDNQEEDENVYRPPPQVTPQQTTPVEQQPSPVASPQTKTPKKEEEPVFIPEVPEDDGGNDTDTDSPRGNLDDSDDEKPVKPEADLNMEIKSIPHALELLETFNDHAEMTKKIVTYLDGERTKYQYDEYIGLIVNNDGLQPLMFAADAHKDDAIAHYVVAITGNLLDRETEKYRTMMRLFGGYRVFSRIIKKTEKTDYASLKRLFTNLAVLSERVC
jgi:hypothetical protein